MSENVGKKPWVNFSRRKDRGDLGLWIFPVAALRSLPRLFACAGALVDSWRVKCSFYCSAQKGLLLPESCVSLQGSGSAHAFPGVDQSSLQVLNEAASQWEAVSWEYIGGGGLEGLERGQDAEKRRGRRRQLRALSQQSE